jgi:hypothetical protein
MNKANNILIHFEKIYEILEFITEEEQTTILNALNHSTEDDWPTKVDNEFTKNDPALSGKVYAITETLADIARQIDDRIESCFENNGWINQIASVQRYQPGIGMGAHKDNELDDSVLFGVVIYLNDNYEGGEIYYQDLDLKIKPKARSMVIHPAGIKHEVLNVKGNNTRYTFSVFVRGHAKTKLRDMSEVLIWN